MSNLQNPDQREYYRALADVISVFWQFHKERVTTGNLDFAVNDNAGRLERFNPQKMLELRMAMNGPDKLRIIEEFTSAAGFGVVGSWRQFLYGTNPRFWNIILLPTKPIPEASRRFMDGYSSSLIDKVNKIAEDPTKNIPRKPYIFNLVTQGLNTGLDIATQLSAIFGTEFNPKIAIAISKTRFEDLKETNKAVGLERDKDGKCTENYSYDLIDGAERLGLNKEGLKELGLGDVLGCPASMKVSDPTRRYLEGKGVQVVGTMLEDFTRMTSEKFEETVGKWYRGLSQERRGFVHPEDRRILDGQVLEESKKFRAEGKCPYLRGKER